MAIQLSRRILGQSKMSRLFITLWVLPTIVDGQPQTQGDIIDSTSPPTTSPVNDIIDTSTPTTSPTVTPSLRPSSLPSSIPTLSQAPSREPTDRPSSSATPSQNPSNVPSMSPTLSFTPSAAPIQYSRPTRVDIRYVPWNELDPETQKIAMNLDYTNTTWNKYGANPIEESSWEDLTSEQTSNASLLGYDMKSWDCWINHYEGYRWIDMGQPFIQVLQWFTSLGWDIQSWTGKKEAPESDFKTWYELTSEERFSAAQLCYFRMTWNEVEVFSNGGFPIMKPDFRFDHWWKLDDEVREIADKSLKYSELTWNVLGLGAVEARDWMRFTSSEVEAAESIGWNQATWDCWINHFRSYSWENLVFYGLDFEYAALGWTEFSWDGSADAPSSSDRSWDELSEDEKDHATKLCYFEDNWDMIDITPNNGKFPYPKPKSRFSPWNELSDDEKAIAADSLQYSEKTWNSYGVAEIERNGWDELTQLQQSHAISLGLYERTWDCFQNHYHSKSWISLDGDVRDAFRVLGWDENSWAANYRPPSYENEWNRLSEIEQSIAYRLCFFEDNWPGQAEALKGQSANETLAGEEEAAEEDGTEENNGTSEEEDAAETGPSGQTASSATQEDNSGSKCVFSGLTASLLISFWSFGVETL
eukprot:CAMPEP_0171450436 /NCGR_PEP_ID=MMETSP0881-20121228/40627_1 /TAXON_ID=67004 /ORGANISM="Thalassiosira weissflogii, Strain CCMP1336" /LENGTH=643 /DNA_ID=CAMNT_0011974891 /DNA_START=33 /DNA_END=1964 /DNA_ORIENTATION=+